MVWGFVVVWLVFRSGTPLGRSLRSRFLILAGTASIQPERRRPPASNRHRETCCRYGFAEGIHEPQQTSKSFSGRLRDFHGFVRDPPGFAAILRPGNCSEAKRHRTFVLNWAPNFVNPCGRGRPPPLRNGKFGSGPNPHRAILALLLPFA